VKDELDEVVDDIEEFEKFGVADKLLEELEITAALLVHTRRNSTAKLTSCRIRSSN
jgi:hypothetical protein